MISSCISGQSSDHRRCNFIIFVLQNKQERVKKIILTNAIKKKSKTSTSLTVNDIIFIALVDELHPLIIQLRIK